MVVPALAFELSASAEPLRQGWRQLERFLDAHRCGKRARFVAALVLEEAVSNIFLRAEEPPAVCQVRLCLDPAGGALVMTIEDEGRPFDPCEAPSPPRRVTLDTAPAGGRGIHLMRRMADGMSYRREGHRNHLEFRILDDARGRPAA